MKKLQNKTCPICKGWQKCTAWPNVFLENSLLRCKKCGLIFVHPQPSPNDIKKIYNSQYFQNQDSNSLGYENYIKDRPNIVKTFEKRLKNIKKLLNFQPGVKVLDIGCAAGFFLEAAKSKGFDAYGVEISEYASRIAKNNLSPEKIFNGTLAQVKLPDNSFGLITMWDCIEHIADPEGELSKIYDLLCGDGLLVLTTPNTSSLAHKIFKQKWMGYKDKEHLYYFSDKNLSLLLKIAGFKVIKKERVGKFIPLSVFLQRLSLYSGPAAKIMNFLTEKTGLNNLSFYVNPWDIVCIYAKKI